MSQGYTSPILLPVTGTGSYVKSSSPNITTPNIVGVTNASDATAGSVGEYTSSIIATGSPIALVTATAKTITSISLTAGDWDVWGEFGLSGAATTRITWIQSSISLVDNVINTNDDDCSTFKITCPIDPSGGSTCYWVPGTNSQPTLSMAPCRINVSTTTPVYLIGLAYFTVSTCSGFGKICARRVR